MKSASFIFATFALLFSGSLAAHREGTGESTRAVDCSEFIYSNCEPPFDGALGTLQSPDAENCQMDCLLFFPSKLTSFYFNNQDLTCTCLSREVQSHMGTCKRVGGPKAPAFNLCDPQIQSDPCYFFHHEECSTTGNVLDENVNLNTAELCHRYCDRSPLKCQYFTYDIDTKVCKLLDGPGKTCSVFMGPSSPSYEDCKTPGPTDQPITSTAPTVPSECTTQVYHKLNGQCACGFYLETNLTWYEARDGCAAYGARLPEIYSAEENADIFSFKSPETYMWIGGNDEDNEGTFIWDSSKSPFSFTNWLAGEPNNLSGKENCVHFMFDSDQWNDIFCNIVSPYPPHPIATFCEKLFDC